MNSQNLGLAILSVIKDTNMAAHQPVTQNAAAGHMTLRQKSMGSGLGKFDKTVKNFSQNHFQAHQNGLKALILMYLSI